MPESPFTFHHPDDFAAALAWDCLIRPPSGGDTAVYRDPTRDALVSILDHTFGSDRVIAERPGSMAAIRSFMDTTGSLLLKRPDVVIRGLDGPRSYVLIDIKTIDTAGPTWISTAHTDTSRLAAHRVKEEEGPAEYFPSADPREACGPGTSMRLVTFVVSTFGALGAQAQSLISTLSTRAGRAVPSSLLDQTSWATPTLAPFVRMTMTMAVRRQIAHGGCDASTARPLMRRASRRCWCQWIPRVA